jgi:hypothetical protein
VREQHGPPCADAAARLDRQRDRAAAARAAALQRVVERRVGVEAADLLEQRIASRSASGRSTR